MEKGAGASSQVFNPSSFAVIPRLAKLPPAIRMCSKPPLTEAKIAMYGRSLSASNYHGLSFVFEVSHYSILLYPFHDLPSNSRPKHSHTASTVHVYVHLSAVRSLYALFMSIHHRFPIHSLPSGFALLSETPSHLLP